MKHWSKLKVLLVVGLLALMTPLAASSHRPPSARTTDAGAVSVPRAAKAAVQRAGVALKLRMAARTYDFASSRANAAADVCSSGAHSLSHFGDRVYPEMGNGGYTSLHSDVYINYDAPTNIFLAGTRVELTDRATQCLSDVSIDFERTNLNANGPAFTVDSVTVNGAPATFTFVQPTYPGDPNGQDDPDPAAHAVSNVNPVSATNPNPPACSPQVSNTSQNGTQCPANKLVVTPSAPIANGATFTVVVNYTGRPGVHVDGDGSTEGWFRTAAPNAGAFVTTEPIGTDSWMPLNNHPSAKPTYDIIDTTNAGTSAIANGELVGTTPPTQVVTAPPVAVSPTSVNPPDANFPGGSWTWHWHSPEPISNYLVENSVGPYDITARTSPTSGIQYFQAVASGLTAARKATIKTNLDQQEDILEFQRGFNGPYPFSTAGIVVALPSVGFAEEMQTKITFGNGNTSTPSIGTINHENMHQWFGDSVAEGGFTMTFWKEGFATLGEYLNTARSAATAAGGIGTPAGDAAFENSLVSRFNTNYGTTSSTFWTSASSNPTVGNLFSTANTYTRPGTAYLALWRALGRDTMIAAMKQIQSQYGGSSITEPQLEAVFRQKLPVQSASCLARVDPFFTQWFDTSFPPGGANTVNKPVLSGPGLNGTGFVCATVNPASPTGQNGWYTGDVSVTWQGFGASAFTKTGCDDGPIAADGTTLRSCSVTTNAAPILTSGAVSETINRDTAAPVTTATIAPAQPDGQNGWYLSPPSVTLAASDATSGLAKTEYALDGGPWTAYSGAISPASEGGHSLQFRSTDLAGNVEPAQTITWAVDTTAPTTTAVLTPGIHNGWYASPALSFTVADGHGSADITDPCPPHVLCGFATVFSIDGGPFLAYEDPAHFGTGNHFVQYRTTDKAGRVESTKLIAFKVDAGKPSVTITKPADGAVYPLDKVVKGAYRCTDRESGMDTCVGTVPNGSPIDTSTVGQHTFTVTATDKAGNQTTKTVHYQVVYSWNGFFAPVTNTETQKLNLVHAGDLIRLAFSLDGNRGLNVLAYPPPERVTLIACPSWAPHSVPAAGKGATTGLSFGVASGHYTYGWQTSNTWAGTCRRFELKTNDGTSTVHTADFLFFA